MQKVHTQVRTHTHIYTEAEAYQKLSALCAHAEYCPYDIRKKMRNWQFAADAEEIAERIIARLVSERFIDENRYAHAFVRDKSRYNKWGEVRIRQELRMRKIPQDIIADALTEIDEDDSLDTLRHLIAGKRRTVKGKSEYEINAKLIRFALSRGFAMEQIMQVIGNADDFDY